WGGCGAGGQKSTHDAAGRVLTEPADRSGMFFFSAATPPQDAIKERSGRIAERWMDDHPRWFVHSHQRIVFVKNVEWNRLRGGPFAIRDRVGSATSTGVPSRTCIDARPAGVLSTDTRPSAIHRCAHARDIPETWVMRRTNT